MRMATETGTFNACHRVIVQCLKSWNVKSGISATFMAFCNARRKCIRAIRKVIGR